MKRANPYFVIKQRILNEKARMFENLKDSEASKSLKKFKKAKYVFFVDVNANKIEIKKALEEVYKVKVEKVNTLTTKPKTKRFKGKIGKTKVKKKAVVTLKDGFIIEEKKKGK